MKESEKLKVLVDRLSAALDVARRAEKIVEDIKAELIGECLEKGVHRVEGSDVVVTIVTSDKRVTYYALAIDEMIQRFNLDPEEVEQVLRWNTKTAEGAPSVRVKKKGER